MSTFIRQKAETQQNIHVTDTENTKQLRMRTQLVSNSRRHILQFWDAGNEHVMYVPKSFLAAYHGHRDTDSPLIVPRHSTLIFLYSMRCNYKSLV